MPSQGIPSQQPAQTTSQSNGQPQSQTTRKPTPAHERNAPSVPTILGGAALIIFGLTRRSALGKMLLTGGGAALAYKGTQTGPSGKFSTSARFRINTSAEEAYKLWRDLEKAPVYQTSIKSVRVLDQTRSVWTMLTPGDQEISWTSEITDDQPGKRLAWRSTPDSLIETTGVVEFADDPLGHGLFVTTHNTFNIPDNPVTRVALSILGQNPEFIARESLRKFKALLEAGEMPTVNGQSHGPRGLSGKATQRAFRENTNPPSGQVPNAPEGAQSRQQAARSASSLQPAHANA